MDETHLRSIAGTAASGKDRHSHHDPSKRLNFQRAKHLILQNDSPKLDSLLKIWRRPFRNSHGYLPIKRGHSTESEVVTSVRRAPHLPGPGSKSFHQLLANCSYAG